MSNDDFEKRLQRQSMRQVPSEWRAGILSAAQQAALTEEARRSLLHGFRSLLSTLNHQLSTLLWPRPVAWAGLAAAWLLILGLNIATREQPPQMARQAAPLTPQVFAAFQEQTRFLVELIGPRDTPVAQRPKPVQPRPRSERRIGSQLLAMGYLDSLDTII